MDDISEVSFNSFIESKYVQPFRMNYKQNGVNKFWDLVKVHPSVSIVIFNVTRHVLVFVKQFRPAVYYSSIPFEERNSGKVDTKKYPGHLGITIEICAGIVDKSKSLEEIAREETLEECGYDVPVDHFQRIKRYKSGVGTTGDWQTMFYVQVTDEMRVTQGGGVAAEGEFIEVVEMSIPEVLAYVAQDEVQSPSGFLFGVTWFLHNKLPNFTNLA